jgi:hypothetical protein
MRILFNIIALGLVLVTPFWIYLPALVLGVIVFPLYLEAIIFAELVDVLYTGSFVMIAALCVMAAAPLREHVRFNA